MILCWRTVRVRPDRRDELETVVVTGWSSHDALDRWIDTPDRDHMTDSEMHRAVSFRPLTRFDVVGGYLNVDGLAAVALAIKENS